MGTPISYQFSNSCSYFSLNYLLPRSDSRTVIIQNKFNQFIAEANGIINCDWALSSTVSFNEEFLCNFAIDQSFESNPAIGLRLS